MPVTRRTGLRGILPDQETEGQGRDWAGNALQLLHVSHGVQSDMSPSEQRVGREACGTRLRTDGGQNSVLPAAQDELLPMSRETHRSGH